MSKKEKNQHIFWITPDRFDQKPDKSSWLEMAEWLAKANYDVSILTSYGKEKAQTNLENAKIVYFPRIEFPIIFRISVLTSILIWLLFKAKKNDIIIVNQEGLLIGPFLWLVGIRNLHLDIRTVPVEFRSIKRRLDRQLFWSFPLKRLRGFISSYSFITEPLKESVEQEFRTTFNDYVIWYSGVNTKVFTPISRQDARQDTILVFYHGSLSENRGVDTIIEAISLLEEPFKQQVQFEIIGSGPEEAELKKLSSKLGLADQIKFRGFMSYDEMPVQIAQADIGIYALPDRPEWRVSSPIKVMEYMACGKPMVLTPIRPFQDIVKQGDFVVWSSGDKAQDIKNAIEVAVTNLPKLTEAATHAPDRARMELEWEIQADKLGRYLNKKYS